MEIPILGDILIILALAVLVSYFCQLLRIPTLVGFLLAGALAGPFGFGLVEAVHEVEKMAEIGVILLLFSIGLEFSLEQLLKIRRAVFLAGGIQVGATFAVSFGGALLLGFSAGEAVFLGFLFSLSSTAVVLKLLKEASLLETPHGRTSLGILLFQDMIIVPMMIFTPMLAGGTGPVLPHLAFLLGKAGLLLAFIYIASRGLIPWVLHRIAGTRNRELFLLCIVFLALGLGWLTSLAGLSLALGAFVAGLMISESPYGTQAFSNIAPFRDIFLSFFFVSVGMLFDVRAVIDHAPIIAGLTAALIALKCLTSTTAALLAGRSIRSALIVGLALGQVGEFSFVLARTGLPFGLIREDAYAIFIAVTVLTILLTPFLLSFRSFACDVAARLPLPARLKAAEAAGSSEGAPEALRDHVVIVGFGLVGRHLAHAARATGIPYRVIELNSETVRRERAAGESILYGDAAYEDVLAHAGVSAARVLVITAHDAAAALRITHLARRLNPGLHIVARTRFFSEWRPLMSQGANEVIPDEFETSVEMFTRVLKKYLVPTHRIENLSRELRKGGYEMLRSPSETSASLRDLSLPDVEISGILIAPGSSVADKTLKELDLRNAYRMSLLAVIRGSRVLPNPGGDTRLAAGDRAIVLASPQEVARFCEAAGGSAAGTWKDHKPA